MPDMLTPTNGDPKDDKLPKAPKGPSVLFTEYYGAAFLFLIAVFVGASFFVLRPQLDAIKQTNAQTTAQLENIARQRAYLSSLQQSVAAAQTIPATTLDEVNRSLPDDIDVPSLLVQFGGAAASNNVRIDSLTFSSIQAASTPAPSATGAGSKPALDPNVRAVTIDVVVHAFNYFDVKRFLSDIETNVRMMDVTAITASGSGSQLSYSLELQTYVFVPSGQPTPSS
ncbi:MAG: hypothetical protein WA001_00805 [Patescibacteria group bacterium]